MSIERICRLLMTFAAVLGVVGVAVGRAQSGRYLALSGCLVMMALAILLLAPKQATPAERRARAAREREREAAGWAPQSYRVPRQRVSSAHGAPADGATKPERGEGFRAA
jgi:uncharacterized membrane protein YfcA